MRVGGLRVDAISDGAFVARPRYFGEHIDAADRPGLFDRDGAAWLPIGCFLVRGAGDRVILVDAGLGPALDPMPDGMLLVGGQLPTGLRALGVAPETITDVVITHLHTDHVGWLFDLEGRRVFGGARIWFGAGEWGHFVEGHGDMAPHIRAGFRALAGSPDLRPLEDDTDIAPGVRAELSPGHTPGSLIVVLGSGDQELVLLGDAITVPDQLAEPDWHSLGDVDAARAEQVRRALWSRLTRPGALGVGAHFPELRPGRVRAGEWAPEA